MANIRRLEPGSPVANVRPDPENDAFPGVYPLLHEHLTLVRWDDGKPRQVSTLMVTQEDGVWRGCLNDRANQRSVWVSAATFYAVLDRLEDGLQRDSLEWRRNSWQGGRRK